MSIMSVTYHLQKVLLHPWGLCFLHIDCFCKTYTAVVDKALITTLVTVSSKETKPTIGISTEGIEDKELVPRVVGIGWIKEEQRRARDWNTGGSYHPLAEGRKGRGQGYSKLEAWEAGPHDMQFRHLWRETFWWCSPPLREEAERGWFWNAQRSWRPEPMLLTAPWRAVLRCQQQKQWAAVEEGSPFPTSISP